MECYCNNGSERIFVAQGYKLTKAEIEERGDEYTWEVDTLHAFEIKLPNAKDQRPGATGCQLSTEASSPGSLHPLVRHHAC
jgi:hypothetical protein